MTPEERRLRRHLFIAVAVKLVVLLVLWWVFVRDQRVSVDPAQTAAHLGAAATSPESPP
jgi:hypothetical protein